MTEQQRDRGVDVTGTDTGTGSDVGPDSDRDESGLGSQQPSGRSGWQGSETAEGETSSVGQAATGSIGAGGGAGSMAGQLESDWQGQSAGQDVGDVGQETVVGGERFEGRARDTGQGGWTTGDSGASTDDPDSPKAGSDS
jgi:hypothetical protein